MNYKMAVEYVTGLGMSVGRPTLQRIKQGIKELGAQNDFKVIHIAGTNGKGSVSAYVSSALQFAGYKTGLFISPHIHDIKERIQINGEKISEADFARIAGRIAEKNLPLSTFECLCLMAFIYFNEQEAEVAMLETGLGGRFDATNAAENKICAAITKIGLDHSAVLGGSIEEIAAEKCGIINGSLIVCSPGQDKRAFDIIKQSAAGLVVPEEKELSDIKVSLFENSFIYKSRQYVTKLSGPYQIENALTAIEILNNCGLEVPYEAVSEGLRRAFIPARLQTVGKNPAVIIDGAHNPDGAAALKTALEGEEGFTAIIGFMRDKDYKEIMARLLPISERVICVRASESARSLSAQEVYEQAKHYSDKCEVAKDIKSALSAAVGYGKTVVVFGSLYLAANALKALGYDN